MANHRPTTTVRIGVVKAAIWQNQAGDRTRYNVTFSRSYRDADGQWHTTHSFGYNDLLVLAKVADRAHSCIFDSGCGKAAPCGALENSSSFPLSHSLDDGDNLPNSSLWGWT